MHLPFCNTNVWVFRKLDQNSVNACNNKWTTSIHVLGSQMKMWICHFCSRKVYNYIKWIVFLTQLYQRERVTEWDQFIKMLFVKIIKKCEKKCGIAFIWIWFSKRNFLMYTTFFHMCVNGLLLYCKNSIYYNIKSNSFLQNNK